MDEAKEHGDEHVKQYAQALAARLLEQVKDEGLELHSDLKRDNDFDRSR